MKANNLSGEYCMNCAAILDDVQRHHRRVVVLDSQCAAVFQQSGDAVRLDEPRTLDEPVGVSRETESEPVGETDESESMAEAVQAEKLVKEPEDEPRKTPKHKPGHPRHK